MIQQAHERSERVGEWVSEYANIRFSMPKTHFIYYLEPPVNLHVSSECLHIWLDANCTSLDTVHTDKVEVKSNLII